mmetsp:Transcript_15864/g.32803  ORF Transcript_15864/g.32803 Transcript_15864/m.32803 type:complete len:354 (-) Transcript_15864:188-1249(-)
MCKTSGKETKRVEKWEDEENDDDDSFASHSRRTVDDEENDNDDLIYPASHSRSIYFSAKALHVDEDLSERSSRSKELQDNGLVARGSPSLSRSFLKPPEEEPYRDSLSTRSQRRRTFDIIQFDGDSDDDNKSVEKDGLLVEEIEPFEKRKRYRSLCFRITLIFAVTGVIGLTTMFGAIEFQKRNSNNNLRGNGTKTPPADALFGTKNSMTNTHGLDVNAGEPGLTNPHGVEEEINPCQDNMAFRHNNHAGQNCQWVAQFKRAQRCANERILTNCRATCDPSCGDSDWAEEHEKGDDEVTEFPTEEPTSYPTLYPTAVVSSWATEDLTDARTAWETEPLSDFASENLGNGSTRD